MEPALPNKKRSKTKQTTSSSAEGENSRPGIATNETAVTRLRRNRSNGIGTIGTNSGNNLLSDLHRDIDTGENLVAGDNNAGVGLAAGDNNAGMAAGDNNAGMGMAAGDNIAGLGIAGVELGASKYVFGYGPDTKLLDIQLKETGTLLGLSNSLSFIPQKHIKLVRKVYNKYMSKVIEFVNDVVAWKKLILLGVVVFGSYYTKGNHLKTTMESRLNSLMADNWDSFVLGMFVRREEPWGDVVVDEVQQLNKVTTKLVRSGEYSKAMGLVSKGCKQLQRTPQLFNCLQSKHPPRSPSWLSEAQTKQVFFFFFFRNMC
jgi:hypothetical protein